MQIPNHTHTIRGDGKGRIVVICDQPTPCNHAQKTQATINAGDKQGRSRKFQRAN